MDVITGVKEVVEDASEEVERLEYGVEHARLVCLGGHMLAKPSAIMANTG